METSTQLVETIVKGIQEKKGSDIVTVDLREKPTAVVGLENAQWVAMDFTDVMVHIFLPDVREYYDMEHLWEDAVLTKVENI